MSDGWDCRRLHHHDSRDEAAECDATFEELASDAQAVTEDAQAAVQVVVDEPIVSPEEHAAAVAEARRRLEEGRRNGP